MWFQFADQNRGERLTRFTADPLNIMIRRSSTEIRRNFFSNRVTQQWNILPAEIKNAKSVNSFKRRYINFISQQSPENEQNS